MIPIKTHLEVNSHQVSHGRRLHYVYFDEPVSSVPGDFTFGEPIEDAWIETLRRAGLEINPRMGNYLVRHREPK